MHDVNFDDRPPEPKPFDDPRDPDDMSVEEDRKRHETELDERRDIRG